LTSGACAPISRASVAARPYFCFNHDLRFIPRMISDSLAHVNSFPHILLDSEMLSNGDTMKSIGEIRLIRLEELVQSTRSKTLEEVAELSETSAAYLSQVRNRLKDSKTGTPKEMGRKVAEKLRLAFDKPPGWMDNLDMQGEVTMPSPVVMSA